MATCFSFVLCFNIIVDVCRDDYTVDVYVSMCEYSDIVASFGGEEWCYSLRTEPVITWVAPTPLQTRERLSCVRPALRGRNAVSVKAHHEFCFCSFVAFLRTFYVFTRVCWLGYGSDAVTLEYILWKCSSDFGFSVINDMWCPCLILCLLSLLGIYLVFVFEKMS